MSIVIKTFSTPKCNYVYDRESNTILEVSDVEYEALQKIGRGQIDDSTKHIIEKFQKRGFCNETNLKEIEHPDVKYLESYIHAKMERIILQVTQNCNLRCSYCAYSGNYDNQRVHTNKTMSLETMKKGVDFLVANSQYNTKSYVGFYGGEPLLEFKKIKQCVEYIKEKYPQKEFAFNMTTNGTLFTPEIVDFLYDNKFEIVISLDGDKQTHDSNRVYANGKGSFDDIMSNLMYIREKYPDYYKKFSFNSVIAPQCDMKCMRDFYDKSNMIDKNNNISIVTVNPNNSKDQIIYDDILLK